MWLRLWSSNPLDWPEFYAEADVIHNLYGTRREVCIVLALFLHLDCVRRCGGFGVLNTNSSEPNGTAKLTCDCYKCDEQIGRYSNFKDHGDVFINAEGTFFFLDSLSYVQSNGETGRPRRQVLSVLFPILHTRILTQYGIQANPLPSSAQTCLEFNSSIRSQTNLSLDSQSSMDHECARAEVCWPLWEELSMCA